MASIPKIAQFNPEEIAIDKYLIMFEANLRTYEIENEDKKKNFLLVSLGTKTFSTLCNLTAPDSPDEKNYAELVRLLKEHFITKPSYHRSLCLFQQRKKQNEETLKECYAELKRLACDCNFGTTFDFRLRDQLFMAIDCQPYFKYLMSEDLNLENMTSKQLLERILTLEKAHVGENIVTGKVNKVFTKKEISSLESKCKHCGYPHLSEKCKFKHLNCRNCGKKGHLQQVCFRKSNALSPNNQSERTEKHINQKLNNQKRRVKQLDEIDKASANQKLTFSEDDNLLKLSSLVKINQVEPVIYTFTLNGYKVPFEIDSGAGVSVLNKKWFDKLNLQLNTSTKTLKAYGNVSVNVVGEVNIDVKLGNYFNNHKFFVADSNDNNLCGRDLMAKMGIHVKFENNDYAEKIDAINDVGDLQKFYSNDSDKPVNGFSARVYLKENAVPKAFKARQVPLSYKEGVELAIDDLVKKDIIEPIAHSEWAAPIVPVIKKDGSVRICADFKYLNSQINIEKYPLPKMEEMLAVLSNKKYFSKLDLDSAYLQIPVEDERNLLVVNTLQGLFKYKRLPFGLSSAPGIFQRYISQLLNKSEGTVVFLDDILISSCTKEQHDIKLREVLNILSQANVKLNMSKCELNKNSVSFLGYVISDKGLSPSPDKINAIVQAPQPTNVTEVKSFVGMATYYNRFIPGFSTVLAPLYELTKKGVKFNWSSDCKNAFKNIKNLLANSGVLATFNSNCRVILEADASPTGVGAVLIQVQNGIERPVAFASKKLSPAETNYSQLDRESLSLIFGTRKFKYYLLGRNFELRTDHQPLLSLFGKGKNVPQDANARLQRWAVLLSQYNYDLVYKPGKTNLVADMLSRLPIEDEIKTSTPVEYIKLVDFLENFALSFDNILKFTNEDPELKTLISYIKFGFPKKLENCKEFNNHKRDLALYQNAILYKNRVLIPTKLRVEVLKQLHSGHNGMVAMKAEARSCVWWPGIDSDIEEMSKSCEICIDNFKPQNQPKLSWNFPSRPWSRIHIDYCELDKKYFLIIVDPHTKFIDAYHANSTSSNNTVELLRRSFSSFGIPDSVCSDNAGYFVSAEIKDFYSKNGIKLINPPPFNPSSNGAAEKAVHIFKTGMKKFKEGSLNTRICRFLYNYRKTVHSVVKQSPSQLMFGRQFKSPIDNIKPNFVRKEEERRLDKSKTAVFADLENKFDLSQAVYARNYGSGKKWIPGEIIEVLGSKNYKVKVNQNGFMIWKRHSSQLMTRSNLSNGILLDDNQCDSETFNELPKPLENTTCNSYVDIPINRENNFKSAENTIDNNQLEVNSSSNANSNIVEHNFVRRSQRVTKPPSRLNL